MEWLFTRLEAHQIQNGRMDLDVLVLDEDGTAGHVDLSYYIDRATLENPSEGRQGESESKGITV